MLVARGPLTKAAWFNLVGGRAEVQRAALRTLVEAGSVETLGAGVRGDPLRYAAVVGKGRSQEKVGPSLGQEHGTYLSADETLENANDFEGETPKHAKTPMGHRNFGVHPHETQSFRPKSPHGKKVGPEIPCSRENGGNRTTETRAPRALRPSVSTPRSSWSTTGEPTMSDNQDNYDAREFKTNAFVKTADLQRDGNQRVEIKAVEAGEGIPRTGAAPENAAADLHRRSQVRPGTQVNLDRMMEYFGPATSLA